MIKVSYTNRLIIDRPMKVLNYGCRFFLIWYKLINQSSQMKNYIYLLIGVLYSFNHIQSQREIDFLFIGSSFLSHYSMPEKFKSNFEKVNDIKISVDGSLHDGFTFYHQIHRNEDLHQLLKETNYKYIIVESHRLLAPDTVTKMSQAFELLRELSPGTSKIVLIPAEACFYDYPRYECAKIFNEMECNIYQDCRSIEDTINIVSKRLLAQFDNLEILPFFHLKELIKPLNFPKKDDKYNHPTDELQ